MGEARQPGRIHAGRLATCNRLRAVHALLADGREHSTLEIIKAVGVCAVNSIASELRANGAVIECRRGKDPVTGDPAWYYQMIEPAPQAEAKAA